MSQGRSGTGGFPREKCNVPAGRETPGEEKTTVSVTISIKHALKKYGDNVIIPDLNAEIKQGEFFTLLGPSGCGKTTLLRMIAGFNSIEGGDFYFNDKRINDLDPAKRNIGMVFQNYAIFPHLTVRKNVEFGLKNKKLPKAQIAEQTDKFMKLMQIDQYADRLPERLSGGQQQRVALARALAVNPRVLLLDEPLSALDAKVRVQLRDEIRRIQLEAGTTTVFVTHDQEEALAVADRIGVMNHGRIEQIADPQTLYRRPGTEYVATFIGLTNRLPGIANGEEAVVFGQRVPLLDGSATDASTVLVRPENMTIELTNDADAVHGAGELGRVEMVHFLGALARVDVRVACAGMGGTIRVTVQLPANELPAGLAIGAQVVVAPRPIPALAV